MRHTTTGCDKPWRTLGYQDRTRVDGPLHCDEPPLNYWIITAPAMLVGLGLAILEIVR